MKYLIRCILNYQPALRSDYIKTKRGWEVIYGDLNQPVIYEDINTAYRVASYSTRECTYQVEEYLQ